MTTINYTQAIQQGKITFEQACALQGATMTQAIQEGILTFEEAVALQGLAVDATAPVETAPKKAQKKAPRAKKAPKKAETAPKAEKAPGEFSYTKGGLVLQGPDHHTLKANHLRRVNNAIDRLTAAGFTATWKRVGGWVYISHNKAADGKTWQEYQAAKLPSGWQFIKGKWVDNTMLSDYEDNFRK